MKNCIRVLLLLSGLFICSAVSAQVVVYENWHFEGRSRSLKVGTYAMPADWNDTISSIKVRDGFGVLVYENAGQSRGFGKMADFLEDQPEIDKYGFNDNISYISVFAAVRSGYHYVRGAYKGAEFVGGHWERSGPNGPPPLNQTGAV